MKERSILFVGALALFFSGGCEKPSPGTQNPHHIFLVTIDTLRADHLGSYGYPRATSPFLDSLAERGVKLTRAFSVMSTTTPSHASMFTSLYPLQHQVLKNGFVLDPSVTTLAEILGAAGYETAAFVSTSFQFSHSKIFQGFSKTDEPPHNADQYRAGLDTVDLALAWLDRYDFSTPLFLWVHLFDPHTPLTEENRFAVASESEARELVRFLVEEHKVELDFFGGKKEALLDLIELYDGEIRHADQAVERLFRYVSNRQVSGEKLWVITADHGEGLGSHRWRGHGREINNEQIRVPLLFLADPPRFKPGARSTPVSHIDLLPTLLELTGLEAPEGFLKHQGSSLVPLLKGDTVREEMRFFLSQRRHYDKKNAVLLEVEDPALANYEAGHKFSLQSADFKYVFRTEGPDEFYDLRKDFRETENLIGAGLSEESLYRNLLAKKILELRENALPGTVSMSPEGIEALRALGYVQ